MSKYMEYIRWHYPCSSVIPIDGANVTISPKSLAKVKGINSIRNLSLGVVDLSHGTENVE